MSELRPGPGVDLRSGGSKRPRWFLCAWVGALLCGVLGIAGSWLAFILSPPSASSTVIASAPLGSAARGDEGPGARLGALDPADAPGAAEMSGADGDGRRIDPDWVRRVSADTGIPERAMHAYAEAAARVSREQPGCGLGWNTLAGIGYVETDHGRFGGGGLNADGLATPPIIGLALDGTVTDAIPDTDGGSLDGDAIWDRAVGPMQFIPATWAQWGADGNGDGAAEPQQIDDAAYSAARYLCATGDLRSAEGWIAAVAAYNNTIDYNHSVAAAANRYARGASAS